MQFIKKLETILEVITVRKVNTNIKEVQKLFKNKIYNQGEYWDATYKVLGKRTTSSSEDFLANETYTAVIDGGDSAQRMGMYYTGARLLEKNGYDISDLRYSNLLHQEEVMNKLYCSWTWGLYRRFPDGNMWYGDADRVGRDQSKPLISSEAFLRTTGSVKRLVAHIGRHVLLRLGLFDAKTRKNGSSVACHGSNCDYGFKFPTLTGPSVWASYIRAAISKNKLFYALYPLLVILDIEILINSLLKQTQKVKYNNGSYDFDNDVSNHIIYSIWFEEVAPTPIIWFMNRFVNSREHFKKQLFSYHDDGRESFTLPLIWSELIDIYFKAE